VTVQVVTARVQQLFATLAAVAAANPVLLEGEVWIEKNASTGRSTGRRKVGDGVLVGETITGTAFNDLPFELGAVPAHASTHATGSTDAITPGSIGAATAAQGAMADSALQAAALAPYRTAAAQDTIDNGKEPAITTLSIAKGGTGGSTAGQARTNIGARPPQIDIFTSSGTWTCPSGAVSVDIQLFAGGGGGSSGRKDSAAATLKLGGGGGGGGSFFSVRVPASILSSSESVTVGAGGVGGAGVTANATNGNVGLAGGSTIFGPFTAQGGGPAGFPAGGGGTGVLQGNSGGTASATGGVGAGGAPTTMASSMQPGGSGGGAGGGITTASAAAAGAAGARSFVLNLVGGTAGAVGGAGGAGGNNASATGGLFGVGGGGGGGGSGIVVSGGAGGAGGFPSGGGGGGGATETGTTSGAGGAGGAGLAIVISYF